jgi:mRNA interferase RelE/StbE
MSYAVRIRPAALKEFKYLPRPQAQKIYSAIQDLRKHPLPQNSIKLKGANLHRLRIGKYRAIYVIHHDRHEIEVVKIGHRKDVYRALKSLLKYMS